MFANAESFVNRLTEVEKCQIRSGTQGQREWMFYNIFKYEIKARSEEQGLRIFNSACDKVDANFIEDSKMECGGLTWRF